MELKIKCFCSKISLWTCGKSHSWRTLHMSEYKYFFFNCLCLSSWTSCSLLQFFNLSCSNTWVYSLHMWRQRNRTNFGLLHVCSLSSLPCLTFHTELILICLVPPAMRLGFNMFILSCSWQEHQHVPCSGLWTLGKTLFAACQPVSVSQDSPLLPLVTKEVPFLHCNTRYPVNIFSISTK